MKYTISAVILAGGKARRMNGADKGLQLLQNKPLISHVIERLQPQVIDISINANRHHTEYAQWGFPVFSDELPDFQGPLSGMLTALEKAKTDFVLFVPCDSPYFPPNFYWQHITIMYETKLCHYSLIGSTYLVFLSNYTIFWNICNFISRYI